MLLMSVIASYIYVALLVPVTASTLNAIVTTKYPPNKTNNQGIRPCNCNYFTQLCIIDPDYSMASDILAIIIMSYFAHNLDAPDNKNGWLETTNFSTGTTV